MKRTLTALLFSAILLGSPAGAAAVQDKSGDALSEEAAFLFENQLAPDWESDSFDPEQKVTRAEFVEQLYRYSLLAGIELESVEPKPCFADTQNSPWPESMAWAGETGLVIGCGGTNACPERIITREEALIVLDRFVSLADISLLPFGLDIDSPLPEDYDQMSDWASEARWHELEYADILTKTEDGYFRPKDELTYLEDAQIFYYLNEVPHYSE